MYRRICLKNQKSVTRRFSGFGIIQKSRNGIFREGKRGSMEHIDNRVMDEERALYGSSGILVTNCRFDGPAVWVMRGQSFTRIPVTCGASDSTRTLITNGLTEGESVVAFISISQKK